MAQRLQSMDELFKDRHFEREIIVLCVRCCLRFKLSKRVIQTVGGFEVGICRKFKASGSILGIPEQRDRSFRAIVTERSART